MSNKMTKEEKEYLAAYNQSDYKCPSVAADIVVFRVTEEDEPNKKKKRPKKLQVLLIKRANFPYRDHYALPGGFCIPTETVEATAARELYEETNVANAALSLIGVYSAPDRDPRGWIISNTFLALINNQDCTLRTDEEAWEADWFELSELDDLPLAFDHHQIIQDAFIQLQYYAEHNYDKIFELLPPTFTLADLQQVFEEILQTELTKQNFRRKMLEYVEETDEVETGYSHRNSKKYRPKQS